MAINLRKILSKKTDEELIAVRRDSLFPIWEAERGYKEGAIPPDLAQEASNCAEVATVSAAVMKERVETGDAHSHLRLRGTEVKFSAKRMDREWAESLRERRGV